MGQMIRVGMADLNICRSPDAITTLGLGSCVGAVIFDPAHGIAGLAHVMLPDSTAVRNNSNIAKFADTGLAELYRRMMAAGASRVGLKAKIAGGAQMFAFNSNNDMLRVGDRNVEAVKRKLAELGIPIIAQDTGKSFGRTIEFYPQTGELLIRAVGKSVYKI